MPGDLQPLVDNQKIIREDGTPTKYFIRWAQQRQIDIGESITAEQAQALIDTWAAGREIIVGTALNGGGNLSADVTINHADSAVVPGIYGDASHVPQITVDQQGHITDVVEVPVSGGGGGHPFWWNPPNSSLFTYDGYDGNNPAVADDADIGMNIVWGTPVAGDRVRILKQTLSNPSGDFDIIFHCRQWNTTEPFSTLMFGIGNATSGLRLFFVGYNGPQSFDNLRFLTGFSGAGAVFGNVVNNGGAQDMFYRWTKVGVQLTAYQSPDSKTWLMCWTDTLSGTGMGVCDHIFAGINYNRSGTFPAVMNIDKWDITGSAV